MPELDDPHFHKLYGRKSPRMMFQRTDFLDYVLMTLITAAVLGAIYGARHPLSLIGYALCTLLLLAFVPRHGVKLKTPLLLRRPQDALYMLVYKIQNLKPVWLLAVGVLLLENYLIYLTPDWPHHVESMRKLALALFYIHFISISAYRTVILIAHLANRERVREVLLQTSWKGFISRRSSITLEIVHAYCTGLLTHIVLIAPWYLVISHLNFSVLMLPALLIVNVLLQLKFYQTFNDWFYRDHWLGHNSELEFLYLHGTHHDAIPSGLIGVAGNGHLEGLLRHMLGYLTPFYNPVFAFTMYTLEIKHDIDFHQYIPGVYPRLSRQLHEINQHSMHHMGSLEPYGIGLNFDQPQVTEQFKKASHLPAAIMNSIKLDERLTGFRWHTNRYQRYLDLVDKYRQEETTVNEDHATMQPNKRGAKVMKALGVGAVSLAGLLFAAHLAWKHSGSNQWELQIDKSGVQVYSLKEPGKTVQQFKAVARVNTPTSRALAAMKDTDDATCAQWIPGCNGGIAVQPWDERDLSLIHFYRVDLPSPMTTREFLYKMQYIPHPEDNSVGIEFTAMPDALPSNDCCIRVTHMHNTWRFTPLASGELQVELIQDMSLGGWVPYFLFNRERAPAMHQVMQDLPKFFNKEKYDHEQFAFVESMTAMQ